MDRLDLPAAQAERALHDIGRVHRWTGIGAVDRALRRHLGPGRQDLLDLGTGAGQVPALLARRTRRRGIDLWVVGVDRKLAHLLVGRRLATPQRRVVADAFALPFRDAAFDWSLSTLLFHHFEPSDNHRVLAQMRRVSRRGAIVVDLRRSALATALSRALLGLLRLGPVARHDGRLSLAQAWSLAEVRRLLAPEAVELERRWPFRFSLVLPPAADPGLPLDPEPPLDPGRKAD